MPGKENVQENLLDRLWQPDWGETFARAIITPIRCGDQVIYEYRGEVVIRPYPNPLKFGGMWQHGRFATRAGAERQVAETQAYLDRSLKRRGITLMVEVIHNPEMTEPQWKNDQVYQHAADLTVQEACKQLSLL